MIGKIRAFTGRANMYYPYGRSTTNLNSRNVRRLILGPMQSPVSAKLILYDLRESFSCQIYGLRRT